MIAILLVFKLVAKANEISFLHAAWRRYSAHRIEYGWRRRNRKKWKRNKKSTVKWQYWMAFFPFWFASPVHSISTTAPLSLRQHSFAWKSLERFKFPFYNMILSVIVSVHTVRIWLWGCVCVQIHTDSEWCKQCMYVFQEPGYRCSIYMCVTLRVQKTETCHFPLTSNSNQRNANGIEGKKIRTNREKDRKREGIYLRCVAYMWVFVLGFEQDTLARVISLPSSEWRDVNDTKIEKTFLNSLNHIFHLYYVNGCESRMKESSWSWSLM